MFRDIGALFYFIRPRRLVRFVDDRIGSVALLIFNSLEFGAGNLTIVLSSHQYLHWSLEKLLSVYY